MKAALLAFALLTCAHGAENPASQWRVRAELLVIRVPQREGVSLAARWANPAKCQTAFAEAQELIASGKGTLVADAIVHGASGQHLTSENTEEIKYPTEFSPHDERLQFAPKDGSKLLGYAVTNFEKRDSGVSFECEITTDGRSMRISCAVQNCQFGRMRRIEQAVLKDGTRLFNEQPDFHIAKEVSMTQMNSGETRLVGTHLLTHPAATMELRLLTAKVRPAVAKGKDAIVQDTPKEAANWLSIEIQKFLVPESFALDLRQAAVDSAQAEAAYQRLVAKAKNGEVELAASSMIPALSGRRVITETAMELRYATEFFPPDSVVLFIASAACPETAFERRNLGVSLETEPTVSADGRIVELMFDSNTVRLDGYSRWAGDADANGTRGYFCRPLFSTTRTSTKLMLENGVRRCIGFQKLQGRDGRVEMTFLKATTSPVTR